MASHKRIRHGRRRRTPPGAPPGTLAIDPNAPKPVIQLMAYGPAAIEERTLTDLEPVRQALAAHPVTWVNVDGLGDVRVLEALGDIFGLHRLALEDVVNVPRRPKVEQYDAYQFVIADMPLAGQGFETEQLCLFLGDRFVLTFQERPGGDCLNPVRERIRQGRPGLRTSGPDYLAYAILDSVIDAYFPLLEEAGDRLQDLEAGILTRPDRSTVVSLHAVKREIIALRRCIWPLREITASLGRGDNPFVTDATRLYLRDCYDHTIQLVEVVETFRDSASGLMEMYLSSMSNRMNEIMKVLTIIATIFMPLSFLGSLYGMNFNTQASRWNMPELNWAFGYPVLLGVMVLVVLGMLFYFRRKGWMG